MSGPTDEQISTFFARFGGHAVKLTPEEYLAKIADETDVGYHDAPFTSGCGIDWEKKMFFYDRPVGWGTIIHEAGHLFVDFLYPTGPYASHEIEWIGWEVACAKSMGVFEEWKSDQQDYVLTEDGRTFRDLIEDDRENELLRLLGERVSHARKIGIVKRAKPRSRFYVEPASLRG